MIDRLQIRPSFIRRVNELQSAVFSLTRALLIGSIALLLCAAPVSAATERDSILNGGNAHLASWAYYTDPTACPNSCRWYISQIDSGKVGVYSLGPIVNHLAGWWTVGQSGAVINLSGNQVSIDSGLDSDSSNSFFDVGLQQWLSNVSIHSDRQKIQGKTVPIKWFFFQAPNGLWYIVTAPGYGGSTTEVLKFSESGGQYNWQATDTADLVPVFTDSGGKKFVKFTTGASAACQDPVVDTMVQEYKTTNYQRSLTPTCTDFTSLAPSTHVTTNFTWSELNGGLQDGNPHYAWGMVNAKLTTGLEATRTIYNRGGISLSSGYRCPHGNASPSVAGSKTSYHMDGRAADMYSSSKTWTQQEFALMRNAASNTSPSPVELLDWDTYPKNHHLHAAW